MNLIKHPVDILISVVSGCLILIGSGCAAGPHELVTYDQDSDRTRFTSERVHAGNISMTGGLATGQRIMLQAFASCTGEACTPDEIDLAFFNDTSADLNFDYRRVSIEFDGREVEWEDLGRRTEPIFYSVPRGELLRVPISPNDFAAMVEADRVEIRFGISGGTVVRVPDGAREPLRAMADAIAARGS